MITRMNRVATAADEELQIEHHGIMWIVKLRSPITHRFLTIAEFLTEDEAINCMRNW